jgi:hypothetical protein
MTLIGMFVLLPAISDMDQCHRPLILTIKETGATSNKTGQQCQGTRFAYRGLLPVRNPSHDKFMLDIMNVIMLILLMRIYIFETSRHERAGKHSVISKSGTVARVSLLFFDRDHETRGFLRRES